jgi:hypothetical protein
VEANLTRGVLGPAAGIPPPAAAAAAAAGPPSSVQLSTPYLDERVRLGKGSRGSLFVFTRGGPADAAGGLQTQAGCERAAGICCRGT